MKAAIYLRVSTDKQTEENQEPDCRRLCEARGWEPVVYREVESGVKRRPKWDRVKDDVRTGVCRAVVVWALDRTGRTRVQVAHDLSELFRWGAVVASVKDAWLDQATGPLRDLLVQIMAWVAEGERARLIERTKAGMARARAAGVKLGRRALPPDKVTEIRKLAMAGINAYWICKQTGVKQSTVRTYLKRFEEECAKKGIESEDEK
jgi:DNA invertase Pin-like site-specific DNA recombinase